MSRQQTLIIARHVLTNEIKYFLANRVPGQPGWNLRALLRVVATIAAGLLAGDCLRKACRFPSMVVDRQIEDIGIVALYC